MGAMAKKDTKQRFDCLARRVPNAGVAPCTVALIEAQTEYGDTSRPPKALDRSMAVQYVINRASDAPFGLEDAYYVFVYPLTCLYRRDNMAKGAVLAMIGQAIDRASAGTRPPDETEYKTAQETAFKILRSCE